jgi:hypothetical protein
MREMARPSLKNSVGPDALGVPGPCFAARETSENLQMISQRRKRLSFAPAASDVRLSDCVKRPSALALERRLRWTPVTLGSCPMVRRSHGYPDFLPRLPAARRLRRLDSLALCCDDVKTFSPEHGLCQIKFFPGPNAQCAATQSAPAKRSQTVVCSLLPASLLAGARFGLLSVGCRLSTQTTGRLSWLNR